MTMIGEWVLPVLFCNPWTFCCIFVLYVPLEWDGSEWLCGALLPVRWAQTMAGVLWILRHIILASEIVPLLSTWAVTHFIWLQPHTCYVSILNQSSSFSSEEWYLQVRKSGALSRQLAHFISYLDGRRMILCAKPVQYLSDKVWYPVGWYIYAGTQLLFILFGTM